VLLYYTGITRVAHNVLKQIVRGVFLNDPQRLSTLAKIGKNAFDCFDAAQRLDLDAFAQTIARSWQWNQTLDSGTNPPQVASIIDRIESYVSAVKLTGAGGGGFIYMIAKDADQAKLLKNDLQSNPPNPRARFIDMSVSSTGLQVTRS
jgi:galactokinase/mevalonate kinase-like predicted kinase